MTDQALGNTLWISLISTVQSGNFTVQRLSGTTVTLRSIQYPLLSDFELSKRSALINKKKSFKPIIDNVLGIIFSNLLANTVRVIISIVQKLSDT